MRRTLLGRCLDAFAATAILWGSPTAVLEQLQCVNAAPAASQACNDKPCVR
jgi:hypothetical protein